MTLRDEDEFDPNDSEEDLLSLSDPMGATEYGVPADDAVGRLVEEDQGVAGRDHERDPVAHEVVDSVGLSAEEAAMHKTDIG